MPRCQFLWGGGILAFLTSCQQLDDQVEPVEETYTKAFIKEFGLIDNNQDWNMATRGSVTVDASSASEVKIYGLIDGQYKVLGDFCDVSGSTELSFDMPKGTERLLVNVGGQSKEVSVGGSVSFSEARSRGIDADSYKKTEDNPLSVTVEATSEYEVFNDNNSTEGEETGIYEYRKTLPEEVNNVSKEGISQNFSFKSDGKPFNIFPVYWKSNNKDKIGILYEYGGVTYQVPVYESKSGDELQYWTSESAEIGITLYVGSGTDQTSSTYYKSYYLDGKSYTDADNNTKTYPINFEILPGKYTSEQKEAAEAWIEAYLKSIGYEDATFPSYYTYSNNYIFVPLSVGGVWQNVGPDGEESTYSNSTAYRSKAVKVTVPDGVSFSFYIYENNNGNTMYSRQELNTDTYSDGTKQVHAATFLNSAGKRCLSFEDWYGSTDDNYDLNDIVFYTDLAVTNTEVFVNEDPGNSYILAAEDLGDMDDFDFNDLVVKVTYTSGSIQAKGVEIETLAAGGTLPLRLCYKDADGTERIIEGDDGSTNADNGFHSCFGDGTQPVGTMINTASTAATGKTYTFKNFHNNFSMAANQVFDKANKGEATNMGGFYIKVKRDDTTVDSDGYSDTVTPPAVGAAPQMICVKSPWTWPAERKDIRLAYPKFSDWCSDHTTDWTTESSSEYLYGGGN